MGKTAQAILKIDANEVVKLLNQALADEWLAYYQYWIGAKVAKGLMREEIAAEFLTHANEELDHANKVTDRIIELGGTPILHPTMWEKMSQCGYDEPTDPSVIALLKQNVRSERCAIGVYNKLMGLTKDKDVVTYHMLLEILKDEIEHEDDLENFLEDLGQSV